VSSRTASNAAALVIAAPILEEITGLELHEVYRSSIYDRPGLDDGWLHWRELPDSSITESHRYSYPSTFDEMTDWIPTGTPGVQYGLGFFRTWIGGGHGEIWGHDGYGN